MFVVQDTSYVFRVGMIEDRAAAVILAATSTVDGCHHPQVLSLGKRISVSDAERRWLYLYFKSLPRELSGNYYRCYYVYNIT